MSTRDLTLPPKPCFKCPKVMRITIRISLAYLYVSSVRQSLDGYTSYAFLQSASTSPLQLVDSRKLSVTPGTERNKSMEGSIGINAYMSEVDAVIVSTRSMSSKRASCNRVNSNGVSTQASTGESLHAPSESFPTQGFQSHS